MTLYATAIYRHFLKLCKTIFNSIVPTILTLLHSTGQSLARSIKKRKKTQSIGNIHGIHGISKIVCQSVLTITVPYLIVFNLVNVGKKVYVYLRMSWNSLESNIYVSQAKYCRTSNVRVHEMVANFAISADSRTFHARE